MNPKHTFSSRVWILVIFANPAAFGQPAGVPRTVRAVVAAPAITILTAATGAFLRSQAAGNASLDLGQVSYFHGTAGPGQSRRNKSGALVISTRFALKIECPGSAASSKVNVTASRLDAADSHAISIDGTRLGPAAQTLIESMACGSSGEHRLDIEVPVSTPAGSIGSTVAFVAALNR